MMLKLLKQPNTSQYVQYCTGFYHGCFGGAISEAHVLSNMGVHEKHVQGICRILHASCTSLGFNSI